MMLPTRKKKDIAKKSIDANENFYFKGPEGRVLSFPQ